MRLQIAPKISLFRSLLTDVRLYAATPLPVLFFFLLFASVSPLLAQNDAFLNGRVCDVNNNPLSYSRVVTVDYKPLQGAVANEKGEFDLALPSDTALHIRVYNFSYTPIDTVIRLQSGEHRRITFVLDSRSTQLGTVTVVDERPRVTTFTPINVERMEHTAGPQSGVETLIKTLPDVSSNNELSSQYSVRGGSFDENLVYINNVEIYRPMLVRNGQQEGSSIINPDLVDRILFSPGGFDAAYGDRMASVLDITYGIPSEFRAKASASLLGASLSAEGRVGERFAFSAGLRHRANRYLFRTLDTKGDYTTEYTDLQALLFYKASEYLDFQFLAIASRNIYGLIPERQNTTFGGFMEAMEFYVYYEGEERDSYNTTLAALTMDYHPNDDFRLRWINSFQTNKENEQYDILSQFWLYELNVGNINADGETEKFDRGVGSFLEHARNALQTNIFSSEVRGTHYAPLGNWNWGVKLQYEQVRDRMREWKWVDSAGYAMPVAYMEPGNDSNAPQPPVLQLFCRANHSVSTTRLTAFVQRNLELFNDRGDAFTLVGGVRLQYYNINFTDEPLTGNTSNYNFSHFYDDTSQNNSQLLVSPRLSLSYKPMWEKNILFRIATGVYSQAPFYREYRFDDGTLNHAIRAQQSYQIMGTMDWDFHIKDSPFKFTADVYYKYINHLIPYRIENLRIRYDAENDAVGYATGISLRISGEVAGNLESWASLSIMKTQEDIEGDNYGWLNRPTDQRISFKLFFQDYIPSVPFWRMSLQFIVGGGLPFTYPGQTNFDKDYRYAPYFRIDWGNTLQLSRFKRVKESRLMRYVDDILLTIDMFNLFDYKNVVSYIWVADYQDKYYPVPNYLTARQFNFKVTVIF